MPSAPPLGIVTSAVMVYDLFRMFGAALSGTPVSSPEYVKTVRPAVRLGRGVFQRGIVVLSSGSTLYFFASASERACISLTFSGILAARSSNWVGSSWTLYSSHLYPGMTSGGGAMLSSHGSVTGVVEAIHPS